MARGVAGSIRQLLARSIDYAGLFPPAELPLPRAAEHYSRHLESAESWILNSFIIPANRLHELPQHIPQHQRPWPVNVLIGSRLAEDLEAVERFEQTGAGRIAWLEAKISNAEQVVGTRERVPARLGIYFEVSDLKLLDTICTIRCRAKLRTGGATPEAIPNAALLAQFTEMTTSRDLPFKCTAGLHHAIRSEHNLGGNDAGPRALMHGFLNVLLAAVFARTTISTEELTELIEEQSADAFRFEDDSVSWRYHRVTNSQIQSAREGGMISFGSCSFSEPVADLRMMGVL